MANRQTSPLAPRVLAAALTLWAALSLALALPAAGGDDWVSDARLCCDGRGGYTTCWRPGLERNMEDAAFRCLWAHERDHVVYFQLYRPFDCAGRKRGASTFRMSLTELSRVECRAYKVQTQCLRHADDLWRAVSLAEHAAEVYGCPSG